MIDKLFIFVCNNTIVYQTFPFNNGILNCYSEIKQVLEDDGNYGFQLYMGNKLCGFIRSENYEIKYKE